MEHRYKWFHRFKWDLGVLSYKTWTFYLFPPLLTPRFAFLWQERESPRRHGESFVVWVGLWFTVRLNVRVTFRLFRTVVIPGPLDPCLLSCPVLRL